MTLFRLSWIPKTLFVVYLSSLSSAAKPYPLDWNTTHSFGYDGPWHAIPIKIGYPAQKINLYPGGAWSCVVLGMHINLNYHDHRPNQTWLPGSEVYDASLGDPERHGSTENYDITNAGAGGVGGITASVDGSWDGKEAMNMNASALQYTDRVNFDTPENGITIPNVSISALQTGNIQFPDNRSVPIDMGFFSLGAPDPRQTFGPYTGNLIPSYLAFRKMIPSNSWSLHIGSVAKGVPGSLILGGYDSNRAIGEFGTYDTTDGSGGMMTRLIDVQLGVANSSASPWNFRNKINLLRDENNSTNEIVVRQNPTVPFLFLPNKTCEAVTRYLPVTWRWDLGLYTWNTDELEYKAILQSPSYLKFVFARSAGESPIAISVPFALLNLTLAPPIVDTPVAYFPCRPYEPEKREYHLGRAFLQAAFLGMNWGTSRWWLAQAPGPSGLVSSIVNIENGTKTIKESAPSDFFAKSWKDTLKDIPRKTPTTATPTKSIGKDSGGGHDRDHGDGGSTGLSRGAIIGIAIGGAACGIIFVAALIFVCRRRRTRRTTTQPDIQFRHSASSLPIPMSKSLPCELDPYERHEMRVDEPAAVELMTTEDRMKYI